LRLLPLCQTFFRRFDAMIDGVSHHVHQNIVQYVDHVPIDFGLTELQNDMIGMVRSLE